MSRTGFIFDMDGCLLNSIGVWHEAERYILEMVGITLSKEQRDKVNTLTIEEVGAFFHEEYGVMGSAEDVIKAIFDYMLGFYNNDVEAVPGALDFVREAFEAGHPMCVLSSSPQAFLHAGLEHAGLKRYFPDELILAADDLGMTKRDTATFDHVCALLGSDRSRTWFFDDSWYAVQTAHEAGLHCVGVFSNNNCGTHEELGRYSDRVVDDFTELNLQALLG